MMLVERYQPAMLRVALMYVSTRAVAEDVVQDAWVGVLKGLDGFEGRSSLRTWIFRILVEHREDARTARGPQRPLLLGLGGRPGVRAVGRPEPVPPAGPSQLSGRWAEPPVGWESTPEERLLSKETLAEVSRAIDALPPNQREVIRMRDVLGWTSADVRNALDISETNQRVLLHRARAKVRRALEGYLGAERERTS